MSNINDNLKRIAYHSFYGIFPEMHKQAISIPDIELNFKDFPSSVQIMTASLIGIRDALILWKNANDHLEGEAAAIRGNLLNLIIDNLDDLVIQPMMEVRFK